MLWSCLLYILYWNTWKGDWLFCRTLLHLCVQHHFFVIGLDVSTASYFKCIYFPVNTRLSLLGFSSKFIFRTLMHNIVPELKGHCICYLNYLKDGFVNKHSTLWLSNTYNCVWIWFSPCISKWLIRSLDNFFFF